jgi:hypothetical protein
MNEYGLPNIWLEWIMTKDFFVNQEERPGLDLILEEVTRQAEQVRGFPLLNAYAIWNLLWWMQLQ